MPALWDSLPRSKLPFPEPVVDRFHLSMAIMYRLPSQEDKETCLSDAAYRLATGARISARDICDPDSKFGRYIREALADLAEQSQVPHQEAAILKYYEAFKLRVLDDLCSHGQLVENYQQAPTAAVDPNPPPVPSTRRPTTWSAAVSAPRGPALHAPPVQASAQPRPAPPPASPMPSAPQRRARRPKPTYMVKGLQAVLKKVAPDNPLVAKPFYEMDPATLRVPVLQALRLFGFKQADLRLAIKVEAYASDELLIRFPDALKAAKAFRNKKVYLGATYAQLSINPWYPPRRQPRAATEAELRQGLAALQAAMGAQDDADDWDLPCPPSSPPAQQAPAPQGPASPASAPAPQEQPDADDAATAMEGVVSPNSKRALRPWQEGAPSVSPPKQRQRHAASTGSAAEDPDSDAAHTETPSAGRLPATAQAGRADSRPALRK